MVNEGKIFEKEGSLPGSDDEFIQWNVFLLKKSFPSFLDLVSKCCGGIKKSKHVKLEVFSFCIFIMVVVLWMEFNRDVAFWVCREVSKKCLSKRMWGFKLTDFTLLLSRIVEYLTRHIDAIHKEESGVLNDEVYSLVRDMVYDLDLKEGGFSRDELVYGLFLVSSLFSNCLGEGDFVSLIKKFGGPSEYLNKAKDIFHKFIVLMDNYNEALDGFALEIKGYFLVQ